MRRFSVVLLAVGVGVLAAPAVSYAASLTWTGGSSHNLDDAGNWNPIQVPATGDALTLTNAGQAPTNNDIPVTVQLQSLSFGDSNGITITGNNLVLQSGGSITDNNTVVNGTDNVNVGVTLNGPATFQSLAGNDLRFFGAVAGTGGLTLNNSTGLSNGLLLNAASSYTGTTTISGNTQVTSLGAIPTGSAVTVNSGATLQFNTSSNTIGSLAGSGSVRGTATLTVGDSTSTTFSGVLGNSLSLTKVGSGTLTLSGTNTSTGTTTVNAGTLRLSGSLAGNVVVNGGTVDATGGHIAGTVTHNGGTLIGDAPGQPTAASGARGDGQVDVSFTAPAAVGSSSITSYTVTSSLGDVGSGAGSPVTVSGLTNGTSYTFTVTATNAFGTGSASTATAAVIPAGVPGAPTGVTATAGNAQVTVRWSASAANGSAVTGYTVTAAPGGRTCTTTGALTCTVTGLTNGTRFTFTVTATNAVGTGSGASASATPTAPGPPPSPQPPPSPAPEPAPPPAPVVDTQPPDAPASLSGRFAGGTLTLSWAASHDNVGVDHYELYLNGKLLASVPGGAVETGVRTFVPTGLSVFTIVAVDAAGNRSAPSPTITVERVAKPAGIPTTIPGWAWKLLAWQESGRSGKRPTTPNPLPRWYAAWAAWRQHPFRIV